MGRPEYRDLQRQHAGQLSSSRAEDVADGEGGVAGIQGVGAAACDEVPARKATVGLEEQQRAAQQGSPWGG